MDLPLISVVMPTYNSIDFLNESISSVLNQTYKNIQFIIVDDGSTDGSYEYIKKEFNDNRIELYKLEENQGICKALNYGLKKVKGDFIARIDSDDVWYLDKLDKQYSYLKEHPEYKACFTWVDIIDENGNIVNEKLKDTYNLFKAYTDTREDWIRFFFFHGNRLSHPSVLIYSDVIKEIGPYNLAYLQCQDFDMWMRLVLKYNFIILEEPLVKYRQFTNNSKHKNISSSTTINLIRHFNEHETMKYNMLYKMDDELLCKCFKEYFRNSNSSTKDELLCERAFLLLKIFNLSNSYSALGVLKLQELLNKKKYEKILKEKFNFACKDFYKLLGNHIYNDPHILNSSAITSTLYLNTSKGFNEKETLKSEPINLLNDICIKFDLPTDKKIQSVRFDPIERRLCRLEIKNLGFIDNQDQFITCEYTHNGKKVDDFIYFANGDPQLIIDIEDSLNLKQFVFEGKINIISDETQTYYIEEIQENLNSTIAEKETTILNLNENINKLNLDINGLNSKINDLNLNISQKDSEIIDLQNKLLYAHKYPFRHFIKKVILRDKNYNY